MNLITLLHERMFGINTQGYIVTEKYTNESAYVLKIVKGTFNSKKKRLVQTEAVYSLRREGDEVLVQQPGIVSGRIKDYTGLLADAYERRMPYYALGTYFENPQQEAPYPIDGNVLEGTLKDFPLQRRRIGIVLQDGTVVEAKLIREMAPLWADRF